MKVNDLIEFLEYCAPRASVCVAVIDANGHLVRYDSPLFLSHDGSVSLVVDQRPDASGKAGEPAEEILLSNYESPQVFGNRFMLLPKADKLTFTRLVERK
jgi:hypothetical protein